MITKEQRIVQYLLACANGAISLYHVYNKPSKEKTEAEYTIYKAYMYDAGDRFAGYRVIAWNNHCFTVGIIDTEDKTLVVITRSKVYIYPLDEEEYSLVRRAWLETRYKVFTP